MTQAPRVLLTGATGAVGGRLLPLLTGAGHDVTCLVRDPARARLPDGVRVVRGDVLTGAGLDEALAGAQVAYYLVHSMGRGTPGDFAANDRRGAGAFANAARVDSDYGQGLEQLLADRPMALEEPAPALTALTNRVVAYLEDAGR